MKRKVFKRLVAAVIALAMVGTSLPENFDSFLMTASAQTAVTYTEYSWNGTSVQGTQNTVTSYTVVTKDLVKNSSDGTGKGLTSGTYVVKSNTTVEDYIYIRKGTTVNLIVQDGVTLTCKKGIGCGYDKNNEAARLNIYGGGTIVTTGEGKAAGIGGRDDETNGWITIHGTTIEATGGNHAAGIGGGEGGKDPNENSPTITIYKGDITAVGGTDGAGIGGGDEQPGARTYIYDGTVKASSNKHGAGIGGGDEEGTYGVHIYGGTVTATGGEHGAGIGAGEEGGNLRKKADDGGVNIYGGKVTATGGKNAAGIGGGYNEDMSGEINISGEATQLTAIGVDGAAGIGAGRAERGAFVTDKGDMGGTITIDCGASSKIKVCGGDNHNHEYDGDPKLESTNSRGGAGIGAGFAGNLYGKVYIKGGDLDITSGYNGAGIGGGAEDGAYGGEGGDVYISGGKILIHLLYDHLDGKANEAIGAGHADSKSGSVYVTESEDNYIRVAYKSYNNDDEDFTLVPAKDRTKKCHTRSTILIEKCDHNSYDDKSAITYTITPSQHVGKCKYCGYEDNGAHDSELFCHCGYKSSEQENIRKIYLQMQYGSPVQQYQGLMQVIKNEKYEIPECEYKPTNQRFIGWAKNNDTENLLQPGSIITISEDTTLTAQYADCFGIIIKRDCDGGYIDIQPSKYTADADESITVSSLPEDGYRLKSITINSYDKQSGTDGETLIEKIFEPGQSEFTFQMPAHDIFIKGEFEELPYDFGESLYGHSISLEGDIGVNFYMELSDETISSTTAYMEFTIPNGSNTKTDKVYVKDVVNDSSKKKVIGEKTYYAFKCNVSAKDMASTIAACIKDGDNTGKMYTYSVKAYADYLLDNADEYEEYQKAAPLVKSMLNYGAAAQKYFGVDAEAANEDLADEDKDINVDPSDLESFAYDDDKTILEAGTFEGATLSLNSKTTLSLYFKGIPAKTKFTCNNYTVETNVKDDYVIARIRNINAKDLGSSFEVKFASSTVTYSPMTYCYNVLTDPEVDGDLKNVCKALYRYWQASAEYFA